MATDPLAVTGSSSAAGTSGTSTEAGKAAASKNKLAKDLNTFLTLLTTQLKYQDPLSPMDSTQFTNQLVQFANVEQQIQANDNLESLIKLQTGNQAAMAIGYLGATVAAESASLPLQDGVASFSYQVPQEIESAMVVIRDSSGSVVYSKDAKTTLGSNTVEWDGKDNFGFPLKDGVYEVQATGTTSEGEKLQLSTAIKGTVTGITTENNAVYLSLGGVNVELTKILGVTQPAAAKTTTTGTQTSGTQTSGTGTTASGANAGLSDAINSLSSNASNKT